VVADWLTPNPREHSPYLARFLDYLKARGRLSDFSFFSFEWYPFDDVCGPPAARLLNASDMLAGAIKRLRDEGLPPDVPMVISEYGWSAYSAEAEVDIEGALLNTEIEAWFLQLGGDRAFLYGWEPNELLDERSCSWGNNMLFQLRGHGSAVPMATYHAARLMLERWLMASGVHQLLPASSDIPNVASYAVRRPDGTIAVLVLNKDSQNGYRVRVPLTGATLHQFSRRQYQWIANGIGGHPGTDRPPESRLLSDGAGFDIPPISITVAAGNLAN
jgi:hypothetical protein